MTRKLKSEPIQNCNKVIYQFICPNDDRCKAIETSYIGFTTNTVQIHSDEHSNNGAIKKPFETKHNQRPNSELIINNIKIIKKERKEDIMLYEALYIRLKKKKQSLICRIIILQKL